MRMYIYRKGSLVVLNGTRAQIMEKIKAWCPSGFLIEIFSRGRAQ